MQKKKKKKKKKEKCMKKYHIWNPATSTCENGECIESTIDDSVIMCDEIIETTIKNPTKTIKNR